MAGWGCGKFVFAKKIGTTLTNGMLLDVQAHITAAAAAAAAATAATAATAVTAATAATAAMHSSNSSNSSNNNKSWNSSRAMNETPGESGLLEWYLWD